MNIIRKIYRNLPVVRELRLLREHLDALHIPSLQADLDEYLRRLLRDERYSGPDKLNRHERQVFSQAGEDGILAEIFRRIGEGTRTFVEIGVGDGLENNTAFLLFQNWSGWWIDGDEKSAGLIRRRFQKPIGEKRLRMERSFVTAENIGDTLRRLGVPPGIDLLSVDIDRNTYWVWKALGWLQPRVVVVEYNASIPPSLDWKVDYVADRAWNNTSYFGGSLKAYELLGAQHGYRLVGCTLSGVNAFFVRNDWCAEKFEEPFTAEHHYEPARHFLARAPKPGHAPCLSDDF